MLNKQKSSKYDECICDICNHNKASECIETFYCKCCIDADRIRLLHPTFEGEGLSEDERARRESEAQDLEERERLLQEDTYFRGAYPV